MAAGMDRRSVVFGGGAALVPLAWPGRLVAQASASSGGALSGGDGALADAEIDDLVETFRARFEVPGLAVCIVRPGQAPFARGYGLRALGSAGAVDAHTRFAIGSNSKAFTSAMLAILVDRGKLAWDTPVVALLPEFRLYDPVATQQFTVRDLLIHNSGLPLGAGDLMTFPATSHTLDDILHGLRFLKPVAGFRTAYAYDNTLYLVAGMIIARLTGLNWEAAVTKEILQPLGMTGTVAGFSALNGQNVAGRHARLGPPVRGLGPVQQIMPHEQDKIDAAGGINASAHDAAAWLAVQLARGRLPDGSRLWSEAQAGEMWAPRTIVSSDAGPDSAKPARSVIAGYALGWFVQQYRDQRLLSHAGGLSGQITQHALLPERGIGLAVYTGTEERYSSVGLRNALLDRLIGVAPADWVALMLAQREADHARALKDFGGGAIPQPAGGPALPLAAYAGRYRDPWYGDIAVTQGPAGLHIRFVPTPVFEGPLEVWGTDSFRTRFGPQAEEDAVVHFAVEQGRVTGVTIAALSPLADFSYDFQHLAFVPVGPVSR